MCGRRLVELPIFRRVRSICRYNLHETARDHLLVLIPPNYAHVKVWLGCTYEQEPGFSNKCDEFISIGM